MKTLSNYSKMYLGTNEGEKIYLSPPSWDCGWYWGFGYLGNKNCHYHLDGLPKKENTNLHDALIKHFGTSLQIRPSHIWTFCELIQTFYTLKETAEVLGRGGCHYTTNPCKDLILNKDETDRINNIVLPQVFEEIYKILKANENNNQMFKELVKLNVKGDTSKVVNFMFEYNIHTDDLKGVEGITSHDFNIIHSYYWKAKHATK